MRQDISALTESEIIALVRDGRREGYEAILCHYADRVFAMIVKLVPNVMDAQELTQDVFLRAFDRINSYDPQRSSLSTWLCRIAYRRTLDYLKRNHPQVLSIEDKQVWQIDVSDEQLEAEFSTNREERIELLERMIDELPTDERTLLTFYYYDGYPLTEIAYITGIDAKVLANRLYRTRKKLYMKLKNGTNI